MRNIYFEETQTLWASYLNSENHLSLILLKTFSTKGR
nr:MAG TPA: hypothetical protein [Caudoviricetes sp.]